MKLPDIENLIVELAHTTKDRKEFEERLKLIELIKSYFGDEDTRLILAIALYFKRPYRPYRFRYLYKNLMEVLNENQVGN